MDEIQAEKIKQLGAEYQANLPHSKSEIGSYRDDMAAFLGFNSWRLLPGELKVEALRIFEAGRQAEQVN